MNLLLFESEERNGDVIQVTGSRVKHLREVLRVEVDSKIRVGEINGRIGDGTIIALDEKHVQIEVTLLKEPPPPLSLVLYLALPRPKFLRRVLQSATTLGIKRIFLFNSYRVEKVYWSCEQLSPAAIKDACLLGLEQAGDTIMPVVETRRLFKPFVEDEVTDLIRNTKALVAHPYADAICPYHVAEPVSLAIGPEGGFIDYELEKLEGAGFLPVRTFDRILKVESAVSALIGRIK